MLNRNGRILNGRSRQHGESRDGNIQRRGGRVRRGVEETESSRLHEAEYCSRRSHTLPGNPEIVKRSEHIISRRNIDPDALKVLYRLSREGFQAFLVGGGVRDLLLGKQPKDFDICTDATPKEIKALFRNSRMIGRRFKIVHVFFPGGKNIEVATLRDNQPLADDEEPGLLKDDNRYGDAETDATRRDLTINGLFYDPNTFSVIDYVGGLDDLENGQIRIIGDAEVRFKEDPVRMIRAIRHAARTGFEIESSTYRGICNNAHLLTTCSKARVLDEFVRELRGGEAYRSFELMTSTGLLRYLLPFAYKAFTGKSEADRMRFRKILERVDMEVEEGIENGWEVSTALVLLALTVGNCSAIEVLSKKCAAVAAVFEPVPDTTVDYFRGDIDSEEEEDSDDNQVVSSSMVRAALRLLYDELGVSRRDIDAAEDLLYARFQCFKRYFASQESSRLVQRDNFQEVVQLLRVTAFEPEEFACLEFCEDLASKRTTRGKDHRRRR